jgi:penicillin-binding protein 2
MDTSSTRLRMSVLGIVVLGCFVALFARLWYLQVMASDTLTVEAAANRYREVSVDAPRGRILDVKGRVIVDNRTSLVVTVDRRALADMEDPAAKDALAAELAATLTRFGTPTKVTTIERRLADQQYSPVQPVPVAIDVPEELMVYLAEHSEDFPAVSVKRESVRVYPYGAAAGNIVGYVGRITAETLATATPGTDPDTSVEKTYQPSSNIGLAGIEASYEDDLRGTPGVDVIEIDADNRPIRTVSSQPPRPGSDVQLNIDMDVQLRAEQVLVDKLNALRGTRQRDGAVRAAPAGSVVVLNPNDGAVTALATYPSYDPSEFVNGISQERYTQLSDVGGVSALVDRSISGQYSPGSTFKLVTAEAALANGVMGPGDYYNDTGVFEVGGQEFQNAGRVRNGYINLPTSLTVSSDTFYYSLGARMDGTTQLQDAAVAFGFDQPTGIDLPGESSGYVLTPADKKALHEKYPDAYPYGDWFTGDNVQLAIGQNTVVVTPLQLANAYAALANGGTVYQPRVAWRVLRANGDPADPAAVLRTIEPVVKGTVELPPAVREPIVQGLAGVTSGRGTAAAAFSGFDQRAFAVVGKTGTAQVQFVRPDGSVGFKADTSLFASYGPADAPQWAVTAVMEESGFGAEASGVIVRQVYELLAGQTLTDRTAPVAGAARD